MLIKKLKELAFPSYREVFYLVLNYILDLSSLEMFYRVCNCFCHEYQGPWYCSEPQMRQFCQIVDIYTEEELYTLRFELVKLIRFVLGFPKDLNELFERMPSLKKEVNQSEFYYSNNDISDRKTFICHRGVHYFPLYSKFCNF